MRTYIMDIGSTMKILDRRDLSRQIRAAIHAAKRDDIRVKVGFLVQFELEGNSSEENVLNVPVDPYQDLPRFKIKQLVEAVAQKLPLVQLPEPRPEVILEDRVVV